VPRSTCTYGQASPHCPVEFCVTLLSRTEMGLEPLPNCAVCTCRSRDLRQSGLGLESAFGSAFVRPSGRQRAVRLSSLPAPRSSTVLQGRLLHRSLLLVCRTIVEQGE
jgi:hypothetical protein